MTDPTPIRLRKWDCDGDEVTIKLTRKPDDADRVRLTEAVRAFVRELAQPETGAHTAQVWRTIDSAPKDGTMFLAWREVPAFDEDLRRTVIQREACIAQSLWGSVGSIPLHSMIQGERITHWMPLPASPTISPPERQP